MSTAPSKCPRCGTMLPADAPEGLCPRCLGALNLTAETAAAGDDAMVSKSPPLAPEQLAAHFPQLEILECLGRGGMGVVYKARQKSLNRLVALKLLAPERVQDAKFAERFAREAQALARLSHPNIVTIHDFGEAGGFYYLLMEFVDGVNLRQLLRARRLTPEEALVIVPPLCDALQYAHERGIVHRDIKPENLLLDKDGRIKIADFGIARMLGAPVSGPGAGTVVDQSPALPDATAASAAGTPGYMAPEQSAAPQKVDARADIYSLGVVFYEMLTGELPGAKLQPPSRKVQIDVRLDEIVLRALEQTPELRYASAAEFRTQVETLKDIPPRPPASPSPGGPRLLKTGNALLTTPEKLATFRGQMFAYRNRGQLVLDDRQLTFSRGGATTIVPLSAIRDVSIGEYPRAMNPAGLDVVSVTCEENGAAKRFLLSPVEGLFALPSTWNGRVADWAAAIRQATEQATGQAPGLTPREQLVMPSSNLGILALMFAPGLAIGGFLFWALLRRGGGAPMSLVSWAPFLFLVMMFLLMWTVPLLIRQWRRRDEGARPGRAARTAAALLLIAAALLGFGRVLQVDRERANRWSEALRDEQTAQATWAGTRAHAERARVELTRLRTARGEQHPEVTEANRNVLRAEAMAAAAQDSVRFAEQRTQTWSRLRGRDFARALLPCLPLWVFGVLLVARRPRPGDAAPEPSRPWLKWTGIVLLLVSLPVGGLGLWVLAQVQQDGSWNPSFHEAAFTGGLWLASILLPLAGAILVGRSVPRDAPARMSRGAATLVAVCAALLALLGSLFADHGPVFGPSARESIRSARIVPVGVTTENVVEVDIVTEVERWGVEVRAGMVGPPLPDAVEQRLRDERPPGSVRHDWIMPLPSAGNSRWRLQPAGRQVWRVGFVLPTPELAQEALASLQSLGPCTGPGGAGYGGTLFALGGSNGAAYRAEVQVTPPVHSGNPAWVSMNGRSTDSGDTWSGTWTVQASQPGTLRVRRGTNLGQAALGQISSDGFHSAEVRLELKRLDARRTQVARVILGQNARAQTTETVDVPYATLRDELQRTVQFSAKTVRGEAIECCRVNGEPLVAEVMVPNALLTAPAAVSVPTAARSEATDGGHAMLAPVVGEGLGPKEFRAAITLAKPRHVALMTLSVESPEGKAEHPGLGYYAAALDGSVPFATLASWTADTGVDGLVSFRLKVSGSAGYWINFSNHVEWLKDYEWTAARPDRSHWVGPGEWNLNDTNSLVIFEGAKRGRPGHRATVRLNFSVFRLPEGFRPAITGHVVKSGADWRTELGLPAGHPFQVTTLVHTNWVRSTTPEHVGTTLHPDGTSSTTYRVPVIASGVPLVSLMALAVLALLAVAVMVLVIKGGRARTVGLALLFVSLLALLVGLFVWFGYRQVAGDFGPGVELASVKSEPRIELTALSPQGLPTPPGSMSMQVQSGYRLSVPPGLVATFQVYERQWDDSWVPLPALNAFIATGEKAAYSEALWWTLRRDNEAPGTNQLWTWRVSAVGGEGMEIPQRPDHETNRHFHVPAQEKIANEVLNWSRLSVPAMAWLSPGQERRIPLFRTEGLPVARGRYPKEIEVRIRCERASELALAPQERRVELGLRAQTVLSWMQPALAGGGENGPAAIAKAREATAGENVRNNEITNAGAPVLATNFNPGLAGPQAAAAEAGQPPLTAPASLPGSAGFGLNSIVVGGVLLLFLLLGGGAVVGLVMLFRKGTPGARTLAVVLLVALVLFALFLAAVAGLFWVRGRSVAAAQQAQDRAVRAQEAIRAEHERQVSARAPQPGRETATAGLGIALRRENGRFVVGSLVPGGSASLDGRLRVGDEIVAVEEAETGRISVATDLPMKDLVELLRGRAGTRVTLQVAPRDRPEARSRVELNRAPLAVLGGAPPARIPVHIDFKLVRVENPPGTRNIRLEFERDPDYGLALEVSQDVTAAGTRFPKPGFVGWQQKTWLGANDGRVILWTLPEEFTLAEVGRVPREIERRVRTWGPLPDGAMPEFATVTHRDGWKYHLLARVLREPGSARPPAPAGASFTVERAIHLPGDSLVRVRLEQAVKDGRKSALGEPLVFKTARNRATGFLVRWRSYPPQQGRFGNRWSLDLVDPDTGVIFHRVEQALTVVSTVTSSEMDPLPKRPEPQTLVEPGSRAAWLLFHAEPVPAPAAAVTSWQEIYAEVEWVRSGPDAPTPAFQMPPVAPPPQARQERP